VCMTAAPPSSSRSLGHRDRRAEAARSTHREPGWRSFEPGAARAWVIAGAIRSTSSIQLVRGVRVGATIVFLGRVPCGIETAAQG
jgi:hypothetical protein